MNWFFLALASAVTAACFTLIQRRFSLAARDVDEMHTSQAFQLAIGVVFIAIALATGKSILTDIRPLNALILAVSYGLGMLMIFAALKRLAAGSYAVLFATTAVWTALLSRLFLGDPVTALKAGAILAILIAVALVSYEKRLKRLFRFDRGVILAIGGVLFLGERESLIAKFAGVAFATAGLVLAAIG